MQWMRLIMSQYLLIDLEAKGIGEILSKKNPTVDSITKNAVKTHYFNSCVTFILGEQIGEAAVSSEMAKETTCSMGRARAGAECSEHTRAPTKAGDQKG